MDSSVSLSTLKNKLNRTLKEALSGITILDLKDECKHFDSKALSETDGSKRFDRITYPKHPLRTFFSEIISG